MRLAAPARPGKNSVSILAEPAAATLPVHLPRLVVPEPAGKSFAAPLTPYVAETLSAKPARLVVQA